MRAAVAGAGFIGAVHARAPHNWPGPRLPGGDGETRPVGTEDAAVMQFETEGGAMGTTVISQVSAGRTNRLWLEAYAYAWIRQGEPVDVLAREPMEVAP